ncbi:MAG TPA: amino acid permease, partial [Bdellovibrionota bacterium]|nr:amino acid permease [Bdellovibrionota bacterium]
IFAMVLVIVGGFVSYLFTPMELMGEELAAATNPGGGALAVLTPLLILRAFASGCTALTGVEAISNGVRAFKPPEADNASRVLRWLAMILAVLFLGICAMAWLYGVVPNPHETVISQLARMIYGNNVVYYFIQAATCAILILAANTSFNDFPRVASVMAEDLFLPRQLKAMGDRLVYSNGIIMLAAAASLLLILFHATTHALIPLYAVGVFLSFTLSQAGMVVHHLQAKKRPGVHHLVISAVGSVATAVVLIAILITKFTHGAWIVSLVIPLFVSWFYAVRSHYRSAGEQLVTDLKVPPRKLKHTVIVPVAGIHKGVVAALEYARSISKNVNAVTVALDDEYGEAVQARWKKWAPDIPLTVLRSPYRSLIEPLQRYIREVDERDPDDLITVVIPSFIPARWWHNFLHNQTSILLSAALRGMRNVVITSVRIHLDR